MCLLVVVTYALLLHDLKMSLTALLARFWRPLAGMATMAAGVLALEAQWPVASSFATQCLRLASAIAAGATIYCCTVLALWWLCGKPEGGERLILSKLWPIVRARVPFLGRRGNQPAT
jgi:hypothetical protein